MSDLIDRIDRQAAIDGLNSHHVERITLNDWQEGWNAALEWVEGIYLNELPSAQPEPKTGHWIPCSERLPEKPTGPAYYSWDGDDIPADEYVVMIEGASKPTTLFWTGDEWADIYDSKSYPVISWMPLPEPYKEADAKDRISKLPSVQTKRETGRWIHHTNWEREGEAPYECDQCGRCFDYKMRFCGFCGSYNGGEE